MFEETSISEFKSLHINREYTDTAVTNMKRKIMTTVMVSLNNTNYYMSHENHQNYYWCLFRNINDESITELGIHI